MRYLLALLLWTTVFEPARADLDALERGLSGDLDALEASWEPAEEEHTEAWRQLVRGFALRAAGSPDAAVEAWEDSVRRGEDFAVRVLAWHHGEQEQWLDAYGWSQLAMELDAVAGDLNRNQLGGHWTLYNAIRAAEGLDPSRHDEADVLARSRIRQYGPGLMANRRNANDERYPGFEPVRREAPDYPSSLVRERVPGWAYLVFEVDERGRVERRLSLAASDPAFARAADRAIRKWRFEVGNVEEFPVIGRQMIEFNVR